MTAELSRTDKRGRQQHEEYTFDRCYGPDATQSDVFKDAKRLVQSAVDGFNVCIFAYGQTGSGKTFTLDGPDGATADEGGITPRSFHEIFRLQKRFKGRKKFKVTIYAVELYKNGLLDLLYVEEDGSKPRPLTIRQNAQGIVHIENVTVKRIESAEEGLACIEQAKERRHTACTNMNERSSRSHLIFSIIIRVSESSSDIMTIGKLTIVDLAGSERAGKTGATGNTLKEASHINKSLLALGDVIQALTTSGEKRHIPYRSHKLTQLMMDSLGGNAKTLMYLCVSPAEYNVQESREALKWAQRVKQVVNKSEKSVETKAIRLLQKQLDMLRARNSIAKAATETTKENTKQAYDEAEATLKRERTRKRNQLKEKVDKKRRASIASRDSKHPPQSPRARAHEQ